MKGLVSALVVMGSLVLSGLAGTHVIVDTNGIGGFSFTDGFDILEHSQDGTVAWTGEVPNDWGGSDSVLLERKPGGTWSNDFDVSFNSFARYGCLAYARQDQKPGFLVLSDTSGLKFSEHVCSWDSTGPDTYGWRWGFYPYNYVFDDLPDYPDATEPWIARDGMGVWHALVHVPTDTSSEDNYSDTRDLYYVRIDTNRQVTTERIYQNHKELKSESNFHIVSDSQGTLGYVRYRDMCIGPGGSVHALISPNPYFVPVTGGTQVRTDLYYLTNEGGSWWTRKLLGPGETYGYGDGAAGASIACAPNGTIAVAAVFLPRVETGSYAAPAELYYMYRDGTTWTKELVANRSDNYVAGDGERGTGMYPHLRFDSQNRPHMVFTDVAAQHYPGWGQESYSGNVRYATRDSATSGAWAIRTVISKDEYGKGTGDFTAYWPVISISPLDDSIVVGARVELVTGLLGGAYSTDHAEYVIRDVLPPPGASAPLAPSGSITSRLPEFSWEPVAAADWYQLWINLNGQKYHSVWLQDTTWMPSADMPRGAYTWSVQTYNSAGLGPWSETGTFAIGIKLPGAATPIDPKGSQSVGTVRPPFSWDAATDATWYHLWVNRIGSGKYVAKWLPAPATSWTPDVDFRGGDYNWWIAGWNSDGYGPWSDTTTFSIPQMRPDAVNLLSPTGRVDVAAGDVAYQWAPDARATWYQVWSGCPGSAKSQWFAASSCVSGGVARAEMSHTAWGDYAWYVCGWGPDGMGNWSTAGKFWYGRPKPYAQTATELQWDDSRTWDAQWYQVWINDVSGGGRVKEDSWWFNRSAVDTVNLDIVSTPTRSALPAGDYEWSLQAWSSTHGMGPWSEVQGFTVP